MFGNTIGDRNFRHRLLRQLVMRPTLLRAMSLLTATTLTLALAGLGGCGSKDEGSKDKFSTIRVQALRSVGALGVEAAGGYTARLRLIGNSPASLGGRSTLAASPNASYTGQINSDGSVTFPGIPQGYDFVVEIEDDAGIVVGGDQVSSNADSVQTGIIANSGDVSTTVIGAGGGEVNTFDDPTRAACKLTLPAGALAADTNIQLAAFENPANLPGKLPTGYVALAGATLSSDGDDVSFSIGLGGPIEIELQSSELAQSVLGQSLDLFEWIDGEWAQATGHGEIRPPGVNGFAGYSAGPEAGDEAEVTGTHPVVYAISGARTATISGRVTDTSNNPIARATVVAQGMGEGEGSGVGSHTITDANGNYSLTVSWPTGNARHFSLTAMAVGYGSATRALTVQQNQVVTGFDFQLGALAPVLGVVSGVVRDSATSQPIAGADVCVTTAQEITQLDYDDAGTPSNLTDDSFSVTVPPDITVTGYSWQLTNPSAVSFTSVNETGSSVVLNQLAIEAQASLGAVFLPSGGYTITAVLTIQGGATVRVYGTFEIQQLGFAFQISRVQLPLTFASQREVCVRTSATGTYTIDDLPLGTVLSIVAHATDYEDSANLPLGPLVAGTPATQNFDLDALADSTDPAVPAGLSLGSVTETTVSFGWIPSTDNVAVAGYEIYRDGNLVGVTSLTTWSDSGLAPNTGYIYNVRAFDASGNSSADSADLPATTLALVVDSQAPSVPQNLIAVATSPASVELTWDASTDNVGVTAYEVRRASTLIATVTQPGYTDNTVSPSTAYSYTVRALDAAQNTSAASTAAGVTTPAQPDNTAPPFPTGLAGTPSGPSEIGLTWNAVVDVGGPGPASGIAGYHVYRDSIKVGTTTATSYGDSGLNPSTSYDYQIQAFDVAGNPSALSTPPVSVSTGAAGGGLLAEWKFDEGSGTIATDSSGNGHNGTLTNGVARIPGEKSLYFDGVNDYIDTGYSPIFGPGDSFTISCWAKTTTNTGSRVLFGWETTYGMAIFLEPGNTVRFRLRDDLANQTNLVTTFNFSDGQWHHYAIVRDDSASQLRGYIDGTLAGQMSDASTTSLNPGGARKFYIGAEDNVVSPALYFQGQLDHVRIYGTARTQPQIQADVDAQKWTTPTGLIGGTSPSVRNGHSTVWTGTTGNVNTADRMIVWGGTTQGGSGGATLNNGAVYEPATDTWNAPTNLNGGAGCPSNRYGHVAVWTGATGNAATEYRMIVWGGAIGGFTETNLGYVYDFATDTWEAKANLNAGTGAPSARQLCAGVWTGDTGVPATSYKLLVWGGGSGPNMYSDGALYDLATDTWSTLTGLSTDANRPSARAGTAFAWTGDTGSAGTSHRLIVWSGGAYGNNFNFQDGAIYDISTDSWSRPTNLNAGFGCPTGREFQSTVFTGQTGVPATANKLVLWGGYVRSISAYTAEGWMYDIATDTWSQPASLNGSAAVPTPRYDHGTAGVWTGASMIIWGGWGPPSFQASWTSLKTGAIWTP
ncbi:MAG: carboxypeptidase regulatory-like domain-containing protein [Planctomycetes bacterium]|nr:carboxypeptidase regulatory-like domain-containing protein [Planctomycetota bacterium]